MRERPGTSTVWVGVAAGLAGVGIAAADTVTVVATRDNTLYQDKEGIRSNGAGSYFFAGVTGSAQLRRGLVRFELTGQVPAGATVTGVTLELHMSRTVSGQEPVYLHRTMADWGEGASNAGAQEGGGALAEPGDATWIHTFYPSQIWAMPGGDFVADPSATRIVDAEGPYSWSGPGMIVDVQAWVDNPEMNFGWVVRGNEAGLLNAKRFDSRENTNASFRPRLVIGFTPGKGECRADWNEDTQVNSDDYFAFLADYFMGDADFNESGETNSDDYFAFLTAFFEGCA